jgi:hypothetical protein
MKNLLKILSKPFKQALSKIKSKRQRKKLAKISRKGLGFFGEKFREQIITILLEALVLTALFVLVAQLTGTHVSSGKVDAYLEKRIKAEWGNRKVFTEFRFSEDLHGFGNATLVYVYDSAESGKTNFLWRHIDIFDQGQESFVDRLLKRQAGYALSSRFVIKIPESMWEPGDTLIPTHHEVIDLDHDGVKEFVIFFETTWVDRTAKNCLFFKWTGESWTCFQLPDLKKKTGIETYQEDYPVEGNVTTNIIAYSNTAEVSVGDLDEDGFAELVIWSPLQDDKSVLSNHDHALAIFQYRNGNWDLHDRWNQGKAMIVPAKQDPQKALENGFKALTIGNVQFFKGSPKGRLNSYLESTNK